MYDILSMIINGYVVAYLCCTPAIEDIIQPHFDLKHDDRYSIPRFLDTAFDDKLLDLPRFVLRRPTSPGVGNIWSTKTVVTVSDPVKHCQSRCLRQKTRQSLWQSCSHFGEAFDAGVMMRDGP
jgi:hypothetical protein